MEKVIIVNEEEFLKKKSQIKKEGALKIQVIADFDKTLTKAYVDGKEIPSIISVLRNENYLSSEYREKAHELYNKYRPIEKNIKIAMEEKKKAMYEWWSTHFDLLVKSGLNKNDLKKVVLSRNLKLREGVIGFIDFLNKNNIPLVIISSSGVGDTIPMYLEKYDILKENIYFITNLFIWDEKGNAIGVKEPIIHSMNKNESSIKDFPFNNQVKKRKNAILLGNNLGDSYMADEKYYKNIIRIVFFNDKFENPLEQKETLEEYKKKYDILILNDGDFDFINELMKEMVG